MRTKVYLAIDLGAQSGRVMAGLWNGRRLVLEEVRRFANGGVFINELLRWDLMRLRGEVQNRLGLAAKRHKRRIVSVETDTWGVDFALLNKDDPGSGSRGSQHSFVCQQ